MKCVKKDLINIEICHFHEKDSTIEMLILHKLISRVHYHSNKTPEAFMKFSNMFKVYGKENDQNFVEIGTEDDRDVENCSGRHLQNGAIRDKL